MPNAALTAALAEAYASAPDDVVLLHTLEIRHVNFIDGSNQPAAVRVVLDGRDWEARLEASAPLHPSAYVNFIACAFHIELPPIEDGSMPRARITLDNVDRVILQQIEAATSSPDMTEVTYRPYLNTDVDAQGRLNGPQMDPPLHLVITSIKADVMQITAEATFGDYRNSRFPSVDYTPASFPGLVR